MLKFIKSPLGIGLILFLIVVIVLVVVNWTTVKGWFSSDAATQRVFNTGTTAARSNVCVSMGGGDCSYNGLYVKCSECTKRGVVVQS